MENNDRSNRGSDICPEENLDRMRKMRSIQSVGGARTIVQIIKPPEIATGGIKMERKNTEPLGLDSPTKIVRQQSAPVIQVGGINTLLKPYQAVFEDSQKEEPSKNFSSVT